MNPPITVAHRSDSKRFKDALTKLGKKQVYVGITQGSSAQRAGTLLGLAGRAASKKRKQKLLHEAANDITNAELMYIQSKGSPIRGIPPRPIIEPAIIEAKEQIAPQLILAAHCILIDNPEAATFYLTRAGLYAQKAAQKFFTDSDNGLTPNAPSTIRAKGSDRPLIDTGALRQAISYQVDEG